MLYIGIALRVIMTLVLIPLALVGYISKAKQIQGNRLQKWGYKNIFLLFTILLIIGSIVLEFVFYPTDPQPEEKTLTFFGVDFYQNELDQLPNRSSADWDKEKTELVRKFKHMYYAWEKKDYEEALNSLLQLHKASDSLGKFASVNSYVVLNNIGVAYYKTKRTKEFKASHNLQLALSVVPKSDPNYEIIKKNITALNTMVNLLD